MTTNKKADKSIILTKDAQHNVILYLQQLLDYRRKFSDFYIKLAAADVAYSTYRLKTEDELNSDGLDVDTILQDALSKTDDVTIPLVASQVDSIVAGLADVFLSGSPIFPVISDREHMEEAQAFEEVIDFHSNKGKYVRELNVAFRDFAKYNIGAIDPRWEQTPPFIPTGMTEDKFALLAGEKARFWLTKLHRVDPYNLLWDYRVEPSKVATDGDFQGEIELITAVKLKTILNELSKTGNHMNVAGAITSTMASANQTSISPGIARFVSTNYIEKPQISQFVNASSRYNVAGWDAWMDGKNSITANSNRLYTNYANLYERSRIYAKIIPAELGITNVPNKNSPQVWEFWLINNTILIYAQPKITAYGELPIKMGTLIDDGFSFQTKSIAESVEPFQRATTDLYHIRINADKRAINDREFYDPQHINPTDINSKIPAAKIPVSNLGLGKGIGDVVRQMPFDASGTASALTDMNTTMQTSFLLTGLNPFKQGQTQKGNRTKEEFVSIIDFSELRSRLLALSIEVQIFTPLKDQLKLNYILHKDEITGVSFRTGQQIKIKPQDLLSSMVEFRIADGYTPRSKLADTEDLRIALEFMTKQPEKFAQYDVAGLFEHFLALRGVKDIKQYKFTQPQVQALLAQAIPILTEMQKQQQNDQLVQGGDNQQAQPAPQPQ